MEREPGDSSWEERLAAGTGAAGLEGGGATGPGGAAWAWIGVGLVLRLGRVPARWDEPTVDYASYHLPLIERLSDGDPVGALATFTGLHPPLYSFLFAGIDALWPAPLGWLLLSAFLSSLAVWATARAAALEGGTAAATVAAAWMAVAPVQLAYGAEVNNYPLLAASSALLLWAAARARTGGGTAGSIVAGALAAWSHVLGGVEAVAAVAAARSGWRRVAALLAVVILCAPLWLPALQRAGEPHTFHQPALGLEARVALLWHRLGPNPLVTAGLALVGLARALWPGRDRTSPSSRVNGLAALMLLATLGALVCFQALGVAAPHQFPYLVTLGPPAALLAASAVRARVRWRRRALLALVLVGAWSAVAELRVGAGLETDLRQTRAVDAALISSTPGDALWLITPFQPDDDKTLSSSVLWRLRPWEPMPAARPFRFDPTDFRYGVPRVWRERNVYFFSRVFPESMGRILEYHLGRSQAVRVVLYDGEREPPLEGALTALLQEHAPRLTRRAFSREGGADVLFIAEPR